MLKFCNSGLRDAGVKEMAMELENDVTMEDLWLDNNFIGAAALAVLVQPSANEHRFRRGLVFPANLCQIRQVASMALPVNCHRLKKAAITALPSQMADIAPVPALYRLQQATDVALTSIDGLLA